jgi:hypothetical protein
MLVLQRLGYDLHATSVSSKTAHTLRLNRSHAQKILHIAHVRCQLGKLRMQVRQLPGLGGGSRDGRQSRCAVGVVCAGCSWVE